MHTPISGATPRSFSRRSRLAKYLAAAYTLLVGYASLYPFSPWRGLADSPFAFLSDDWPRYYTATDVALNVFGYLPLGLLVALSAMASTSVRWAALLGALVGSLVSLTLETLQSFLPPRVPSNLDLLSNCLGALAGALIAVTAGERWLLSGQLQRLRSRIFLPGAWTDAGFVILVLWLFTQLYPSVWLFGNGDLRFLVRSGHNFDYSPGSYRFIEAAVTALNLAAVALFMSSLARPGRRVATPLLLLVTAALLIKSAGALTLFKAGDASLWLTAGAMLGVPAGVVLSVVLGRLPRRLLPPAAAVCMLSGAVLVNLAPENPYIAASIQMWQRAHFLSFNGTTRLVSSLWPFLAAGYLSWWTWQGVNTPLPAGSSVLK